ncbi:hypothetical protein O6H91_14G023200 [Diphasiastrum complanatum]|uniref:Uncharacterized protein n=1 Tax=Diphasiastrum complanatum TaxID=34168 RepID=A0ACC2BM80_DIPCM|nr:hypothetical protein O6H91_14G023200 [Diphasiastrum complanatum]
MQPLSPSNSGTKSSCRPKRTRQCTGFALSITTEKATFKKPFTAQQKAHVLRPLTEINGRNSPRVKSYDSASNIKKEACTLVSNKGEKALEENTNNMPGGRWVTASKYHSDSSMRSASKPPFSAVPDRKSITRKPTSLGQNLQNLMSTKKVDSRVTKRSDLKGHMSSFWGAQAKTASQSLNHVKEQTMARSNMANSSALATNTLNPLKENLTCSKRVSETKLPDKDEANAILHSVSYWLSQIQLAEVAEKHHVSVALFRLSLQCGAEPTHKILESMKHYKKQYSAVAGGIENILLDVENGTFVQTADLLAVNVKTSDSLASTSAITTVPQKQSAHTFERSATICSAGETKVLCESKDLNEDVEGLAQIEVCDALEDFLIGPTLHITETKDDSSKTSADKLKMINGKDTKKKQVEDSRCNLNDGDCSSNIQFSDEDQRFSLKYEKPFLDQSNEERSRDSCSSNIHPKTEERPCSPTDVASAALPADYETRSSIILTSTSNDTSNAKPGLVPASRTPGQCSRIAKCSSQSQVDKTMIPPRRTPRRACALRSSAPRCEQKCNKEVERLSSAQKVEPDSELSVTSQVESQHASAEQEQCLEFLGVSAYEHQKDKFGDICNVSHDLSDKAAGLVITMDVDSLMKEVVSCIISSSTDDMEDMEAVLDPQLLQTQKVVECSSIWPVPVKDMGERSLAMNIEKDNAMEPAKGTEAGRFVNCSLVTDPKNAGGSQSPCKLSDDNTTQSPNLSELLADNTFQQDSSDLNADHYMDTIVPKNSKLDKMEIQYGTEYDSDLVAAEKTKNVHLAACSEPVTEQQEAQQVERKPDNKCQRTSSNSDKFASLQAATTDSSVAVTGIFLSTPMNDVKLFLGKKEAGDDTEEQLNSALISKCITPTVPDGRISSLKSNLKTRGTRSKTQSTHSAEETEKKLMIELQVPDAAVEIAHDEGIQIPITSANTKIEDKPKVLDYRNSFQKPPAKAISLKSSRHCGNQGKVHRRKVQEISAGYHTPKFDSFECYQMSPKTASVKGKRCVLRSTERICSSSVVFEVDQKENVQSSTTRKTRSCKSEYKRSGIMTEAKGRCFRKSAEFQRSVVGIVAKNLEMELGNEIICKDKERNEVQTKVCKLELNLHVRRFTLLSI